MASNNVAQFAAELKMPANVLLKQLKAAGSQKINEDDTLSEDDKALLLDHLRKSRGVIESDNRKITITRKHISEIRQADATGKARTIQVEIRKKRTFIKSDEISNIIAEKYRTVITEVDNGAEMICSEEETIPNTEHEEADESLMYTKGNNTSNLKCTQISIAQLSETDIQASDALANTLQTRTNAKENNEELALKLSDQSAPVERIDSVIQKSDDETLPSQKEIYKFREVAEEEVREIREMINTPRNTIKKNIEPSKPDKIQKVRGTRKKSTNLESLSIRLATKEKKPVEVNRVVQNGRFQENALKRRGIKTNNKDSSVSIDRRRRARSKKNSKQYRADNKLSFQVPVEPIIRNVHIPETISISELAHKMSIKASEVIKVMINMGQMATINQVLDQETAMIIVEELGHRAIWSKFDNPEALLIDNQEIISNTEQLQRPPVVTIMGHVDHGKTSLLDCIRRSNVIVKEAGGITQHICAYHVDTSHGVVTFLDTPGHEAFTAMRARGTKVTDIIILVIAADDGVMPQTKEAIAHAKSSGIPIIVAINKIDKPDANPDRVKQELITEGIVPEEYGGDSPFIVVSAKTGLGIDNLLENLLLQAEVLELKAPVEAPAKGIVIEAKLDKGKGPIATILVQSGTLNRGDIVIVGSTYGRVRAMLDENGELTKKAGPSIPVEIHGLSEIPSAGDELIVLLDERKAREIALFRQGKFRDVKFAKQQAVKLEGMLEQMSESEIRNLNLIIKSDVQGSKEALIQALLKLSTSEIRVKIVHSAVGSIGESDVNLAAVSKAVIIGFNTLADSQARKLAEAIGIDIRCYNVIYDVVNEIKVEISRMLSPEKREILTAVAEVRQVFKVPKIGTIAGCMVIDGVVKRTSCVRVIRNNVIVFTGELDSLKRIKDDVKEVKQGFECGISLKNFIDIVEGDRLEVFEVNEITRSL
ncbi:MAG: translation initiation factor IF-2 [Burkholderia sp.]|nr:translation initiation factor IF-2 [Burkholderia sp.]